MKPKLPISFFDYQRIFQVITAVQKGAGRDPSKGCVFYSFAGRAILDRFYGKHCGPIAGAAIYAVDEAKEAPVLSFLDQDSDFVTSTNNGFHCWVECEDFAIDFMAPMFRESLRNVGLQSTAARKMFQKPLSGMSSSPDDVQKPGDFFLIPNTKLSLEIVDGFYSRQENEDLINACLHWYVKPPKPIKPTITLMDSKTGIVNMPLSNLQLTGNW